MDQQQLASTVGATLVQLQRKGVSATIRHFSGEAADAVRGPPCALQIRRQLMTAWPWRLGPVRRLSAPCETRYRTSRSAWEPQYLCMPSEQHKRGRNWFVVPLPGILNENVLCQRARPSLPVS